MSVGRFCLSIDVELAWGEFHRRADGRVDVARLRAARALTPRLLALLARHGVAASFAVVGHLLQPSCPGHDEAPRPRYGFGPADWFDAHPRGDERSHPEWYAPSLARRIRAADERHDIGAHGYTHALLGVPGADLPLARYELAEAARCLRQVGLPTLTFVFPRNSIDCLEVLKSQGFVAYRGVEPGLGGEAPVRRLRHGLRQLLALTPATGQPLERDGLWELPSSMLYLSREGWRHAIPLAARVRRAMRGLERARGNGEVFHLWLHLEDLVPDSESLLAGLDSILGRARDYERNGELRVRTMRELAADAAAGG